MRYLWLLFAFMSSGELYLFGQACPTSSDTGPSVPSEVRALEGQLVS